MAGLEGSIVKSAHEMALPTLGKEVNHRYGNAAVALTKPSGTGAVKATVLYLHAEKGNFRVQVGSTTGTISSAAPSASVTNGTGSILLTEGSLWTVAAPGVITVVGDAADATLTYWWL